MRLLLLLSADVRRRPDVPHDGSQRRGRERPQLPVPCQADRYGCCFVQLHRCGEESGVSSCRLHTVLHSMVSIFHLWNSVTSKLFTAERCDFSVIKYVTICKIDLITDMYLIMTKNEDEECKKKILFLNHQYVNYHIKDNDLIVW